jgi:Protein of unknown function (DUF3999)
MRILRLPGMGYGRIVLALVAVAGMGASTSESQYRWSRAVKVPAIEQPRLEAVVLDSSIFAATKPNMADLRLRGDTDEPVAFVLRQTPTSRQRTVVKRWTAVQTGAKPVTPDGLDIFFDPPKDEVGPFDAISIETPLRDFEQQVRVFSSADGQTWQPLGPTTVIFDYSRFVDVRSVEVPISQTADRHFRLVIEDVTAEQASELSELTRHFRGTEETDHTDRTVVERRPLRVDRITLLSHRVETELQGSKRIAYPTTDFQIHQDPKQKWTILDFRTDGEPLTGLTLLTDQTNFSRTVTLQVPSRPGADEWQSVTFATLTRFSFQALKKDELKLTFPEQRATRYRLVVENRDSPTVPVRGVEAEGPEYQLIFLATPGQTFRLEYGWPDAPAAVYDTAAIDASLAAHYSPELVELGVPVETVPVAPELALSTLLNDPRVVIGVLAGLSVILGWGLYRASRRIDLPPQV